jgi:hypothetical protein
MANKKSPDSVRSDISIMLAMWRKNPSLALPDLDLKAYEALVASFQEQDQRVQELEMDATTTRIAREDLMNRLASYHTRLRSATRGMYGPDSAQMSQAGLVRRSDRKSHHDSETVPAT